MRYLLLRMIMIGCVLVLSGCAVAMVGMTQQELLSTEGKPGDKWAGANGTECWRYGARHVFLQNDRVTKIVGRERYFNSSNLMIGLPEAAVISLQGPPMSVSAKKDVKYLVYKNRTRKFRSNKFYIRIINGVVESYGGEGDFDMSKTD
jgi:hypothetical protein